MNQVINKEQVASITYTFTTGPLAGHTLQSGHVDTHPQHGRGVRFQSYANKDVFRKVGIKMDAVFARLETNPGLAELADEYEVLRQQNIAAITAERDEKIARELAEDAVLLEKMYAREQELLHLIPKGHTRVKFVQTGSADGDAIGNWVTEGGREVPWTAIVVHGWAQAIREGALAAFEQIAVASIAPEELARLDAEEDLARAEAAARMRETTARREAIFAEARQTGQPVALRQWSEECDGSACECDHDIVTEYALPSGGTRRERIHTH